MAGESFRGQSGKAVSSSETLHAVPLAFLNVEVVVVREIGMPINLKSRMCITKISQSKGLRPRRSDTVGSGNPPRVHRPRRCNHLRRPVAL